LSSQARRAGEGSALVHANSRFLAPNAVARNDNFLGLAISRSPPSSLFRFGRTLRERTNYEAPAANHHAEVSEPQPLFARFEWLESCTNNSLIGENCLHANSVQRLDVCVAPDAQGSRLHHGGCNHAGLGHRSQCRDLHAGLCHSATAVAGKGCQFALSAWIA